MGLFKKKAGGTFFGNLLRGVGSAVSGGLLGKGMGRIEIGQTKTNRELMKEAKAIAKAGGTVPNVIAPSQNKVSTAAENVVSSILGNNGGSSGAGGTDGQPWKPIEVGEDGKARLNIELPQVQAEVGLANSPVFWIAGGLVLLALLKR